MKLAPHFHLSRRMKRIHCVTHGTIIFALVVECKIKMYDLKMKKRSYAEINYKKILIQLTLFFQY